jgi:hypothetical protein
MRKIIYTKPGGSVAVVHPVRNTRGDESLSDLEIEQRAWARLPKGAITPEFVDAQVIPQDRKHRSAWRQQGKGIHLDAAESARIDATQKKDLRSELDDLRARLKRLEEK